MSRPDEGLLHAWLDGELEAEEAARVERLVAEDAEWSAAAAEARGLIAASSRILGKLDVVVEHQVSVGVDGGRRPVHGFALPKTHAVSAYLNAARKAGEDGLNRRVRLAVNRDDDTISLTKHGGQFCRDISRALRFSVHGHDRRDFHDISYRRRY